MTKAPESTSTLPPSESATAGVDAHVPGPPSTSSTQRRVPPGSLHGRRAPNPPPTAPDATHSATSTTAPGTTTTTTLPPGLPPEKCPDAKTCRRYAFQTTPPARWPVTNGKARISYFLNPAGCTLSSEDMRRALDDATSSWERYAPTLDFSFAGLTDRLPVPDGYNVVGCTGPSTGSPTARDGLIREADMLLTGTLTYAPCNDQADNSCTPLGGSGYLDAASVATHEFGHWLWLGDMSDNAVDRELTMSPGDTQSKGRTRHWRTLALGDVLGVRALYPCSCPLPTIYAP